MPTLHWVGKNKVVNHHHDVPFRLLDKQYSFTANEGTPANSTNNRIIHGDNLEALKSLLPEFEGKVNCIYIDPPYNTGNEGWVYNDAVNDPKIKKWLGQVVGKEGEDLSRHDKWLCMMYPRLKLLHRLLADNGVIFVSIDDNEVFHLQLLLNEIFGLQNLIANLVWKRKAGGGDDSEHVATEHEYVLCYAKRKQLAKISRVLHESPAMTAKYNKIENGRRYYLERLDKTSLTYSDSMDFPIECPDGTFVSPPHPDPSNPTTSWRWSEDTVKDRRSELEFIREKKTSEWRIYTRTWEPLEGVTPRSLLVEKDFGRNRDGTQELDSILGPKVFNNPKPTKLLTHLMQMGASEKNSLILDSFSGSGSTAHAVLKLNNKDGGNRRFILCETMNYAETITAERVRRVMNGYGEGNKAVAGTGGGFDFYTVGTALFKEDKNLNEEVGAEAIREYVAYTESIQPEKRFEVDNPVSPYALGATDTALCVFYYERDRVTTLDIDFLGQLKIKNLQSRPEQFVIYADKCALDKDFLYKHGITFKRIPRDITRF
ncbi:site-specific DNA-methyltransferase [Burkholderia cenocepacia]|uniref:site-specific DNA-methyltransferase n=1 Tax=Burkholderia cenocepacia TaxID=95486 RepID=UPI002ABDDEF9|nr:site-specific DNA-methyltransferase [Burkholderia cenocepacia]